MTCFAALFNGFVIIRAYPIEGFQIFCGIAVVVLGYMALTQLRLIHLLRRSPPKRYNVSAQQEIHLSKSDKPTKKPRTRRSTLEAQGRERSFMFRLHIQNAREGEKVTKNLPVLIEIYFSKRASTESPTSAAKTAQSAPPTHP